MLSNIMSYFYIEKMINDHASMLDNKQVYIYTE